MRVRRKEPLSLIRMNAYTQSHSQIHVKIHHPTKSLSIGMDTLTLPQDNIAEEHYMNSYSVFPSEVPAQWSQIYVH